MRWQSPDSCVMPVPLLHPGMDVSIPESHRDGANLPSCQSAAAPAGVRSGRSGWSHIMHGGTVEMEFPANMVI